MNTRSIRRGHPQQPGWRVRMQSVLNPHALDIRLLSGEPPDSSPELAERCARLLDPLHLGELAKGLERVVDEASQPACSRHRCLSTKVPLRRQEIVKNRSLLLALARDLLEEPQVQVRGVILVDKLLCDGRSPLYDAAELINAPEGDRSIEGAARHARTALLLQ